MEREREGASVKSQERKGEERESRKDRIQTLDAEDKGPNSVRGSRGGEERGAEGAADQTEEIN